MVAKDRLVGAFARFPHNIVNNEWAIDASIWN